MCRPNENMMRYIVWFAALGLMAMGMMMVPPVVVSLPFKIAFFVIADGWLKITEALLRGYGVA